MRPLRQLNTKRHAVTATAALVLAGGLASVVLATVAQAAPKTPTPTITAGPSGTTTSASATFSFTGSASQVKFQCALDAGSFSICSSPKTFTGLADGSHTFKVTATAPAMSVSDEATRTWTVDTRAPAISVASPTNGAAYNAAGWTGPCSGGGVCGTAADPGGVSQVTVAVLQQATGRYWDGSAFSPVPAVFHVASGTTDWRFSLTRPVDGSYTASIRARDALSNATTAANQVNVGFRIDTVAPAAPELTKKPDDPTDKSNAQFNWTSPEPGLSHRCALDGAPASTCAAGGVEYKDLTPGDHCFTVGAVDAAGNVGPITTSCWTVLISGGFGITGDVVGLLAPGVSRPVNLVITNSVNFAIKVTSVAVTINPAPSGAGCATDENFTVVRSLVGSVTVPANATRSLERLGIDESRWPLVGMINRDADQDACKNATISLSYTGTATKP